MPTPSDLRDALSDLSTIAEADLDRLWRELTSADQAQEAMLDVLPDLTRTYGLAAGAVAADWYDETRDELNIDGRFSAIVAEIDDGGLDVLARWGVGPLYAAEPDWDSAKSLIAGGVQRKITNVSRETVMGSSIDDPKARGWQRSASGGCGFCRMLAGRGTVYSRGTVDFGAHNNCKCVAVAAFDDRELPVKPYTPSLKTITDADRKRTREYIARWFPDDGV